MFAATFLIIHFARKFDKTIKEPIDDETRHAFDDWFRDAAKGGPLEADPTTHDGSAHSKNVSQKQNTDGDEELAEAPQPVEEDA